MYELIAIEYADLGVVDSSPCSFFRIVRTIFLKAFLEEKGFLAGCSNLWRRCKGV